MEEGTEGDCVEVECLALRRGKRGVDFVRQPEDSVNVRDVVGGVIGRHVGFKVSVNRWYEILR